MEFNQLIYKRKSIRDFNDKEVGIDSIDELLKCATLAPSAGNSQPWQFFVIKDKVCLNKIADASGQVVKKANALIVVCANKKISKKYYGKRGTSLYCYQDTAAATQNILLCAANKNIGACWCGDFNEKRIKCILNLGKNITPTAIVALGHYDVEPTNSPRVDAKELTTYVL